MQKITRDISERREAAAALEKANAVLFQAQKMKAIGWLTGSVAHDFNNLLSVLSNGLQVLTMQSRTPFDSKTVESMRRAVDRGASLTQQLLSFVRQQPLQTETFDLNALIRDSANAISRRQIPQATADVHGPLHFALSLEGLENLRDVFGRERRALDLAELGLDSAIELFALNYRRLLDAIVGHIQKKVSDCLV